MRYETLHGVSVPKIGFGTWRIGGDSYPDLERDPAAMAALQTALEVGYTHFDTAEVYASGHSEELLGRAIRETNTSRESVFITTKVSPEHLQYDQILKSCENSLRRLQMDYVDLYQIHRFDPETPVEETLEALNDVVRSGRARYIGASSMFAWQFAKMLHTSDLRGSARFVSMQDHYNLVYREEEREMIPLCIDQGIGLIPWSPLARGFFAGDRKRGGGGETVRANSDPFGNSLYFRDEDFAVAEGVAALAKERDVTGSQIALAWILSKPHVTAPIVGATKMDHLNQAIAALDIRLSEEEIRKLEELYKPHPVLGHS